MWMRFDFTDSADPVIFERPDQVLVAYCLDEVLPCLGRVKRAVQQGSWAAGFICYEAAPALDPVLVTQVRGRLPLLVFGLYRSPSVAGPATRAEPPFHLGPWRHRTKLGEYERAFATIQHRIAAGLSYQVNYTVRLDAEFSGDPRGLYRRLQSSQQGSCGAYVEWQDVALLSASPELFFRIDANGQITCRPMKGTAPRGRYGEEDERYRRSLETSVKDRAENVMIVDLLRNDLGKVARVGSVAVHDLYRIEAYPSVYQMTSTVQATLNEGNGWYEAMVALFPCASVTGAPKASTMSIIRELEASPRGIYCGTLGYVRPDGRALFNVAIRTVTIDLSQGQAEFSAGGGITAESEVLSEYQEVQTKSRFLQAASPSLSESFELLETMRLDHGHYWLLAEHLQRLSRSAQFLGWAYPTEAIISHLEEAKRVWPTGRWRVRLRLNANGKVSLESASWQPRPAHGQVVAWAETSNVEDLHDFRMFHKTTDRARYLNWHDPQSPLLDHLLWDEKGHATEFTRGNLVVDWDGKLLTPPLACGLLPGTFRQWLLDRGLIEPQTLTRAQVEQADQLWFVNSVEGWIPVSLQRAERGKS